MSVPYKVIFEKMEQEIGKAKAASKDSEVKAHIYAVKMLAEMVLDRNDTESSVTPVVSKQVPPPVKTQPLTTIASEPIDVDDGVNGDSIFDF